MELSYYIINNWIYIKGKGESGRKSYGSNKNPEIFALNIFFTTKLPSKTHSINIILSKY